MSKFTGYKCDVCNNAENSSDRPRDWFGVKLPNVGNGDALDTFKDICSDKCLLKFAKERNGSVTVRKSRNPELAEYLKSLGYKPSQVGPLAAGHARHGNIYVDDCVVCKFYSELSEKA